MAEIQSPWRGSESSFILVREGGAWKPRERPADPEQTETYAAEGAGLEEDRFRGTDEKVLADAQEFVNSVTMDRFFQQVTQWPGQYIQVRPAPQPGWAGLCSHINGMPSHIALGGPAMANRYTLIHELAHACVPHYLPSHGKHFRAALVVLVHHYLGAERGIALIIRFLKAGLAIGPMEAETLKGLLENSVNLEEFTARLQEFFTEPQTGGR